MTNNYKSNQVTPFAEIWHCQETGKKSLHAKVVIKPYQSLWYFSAKEILHIPNSWTFQIDCHKHIYIDPEFLQYINHSCDPNLYFDTTNMKVITLSEIKPTEEFTWFYPSTEWLMAQSFDCLCGSENCLKNIKGANYLSVEILSRYRLSEHIKKKCCLS